MLNETTKKYITVVFDLIQWFVVILLIFVASALILSSYDNPLQLRVFSVNSGSMSPAIKTGSLVFVRPADSYNVDDVVTFFSRNDPEQTTTHRIVSISEDVDLGFSTLGTKGDANEDPDPFSIRSDQILGSVVWVVPLIGYLVAFAKTQLGFTLLVVVPATLLIYTELSNIRKELVAYFKEKQAKKLLTINQPPEPKNSKKLPKDTVIEGKAERPTKAKKIEKPPALVEKQEKSIKPIKRQKPKETKKDG